jgi:hypothetical protein
LPTAKKNLRRRNDEALIDAVFGSVVTQTRVLENGEKEVKDVWLDDGYWGHAVSEAASLGFAERVVATAFASQSVGGQSIACRLPAIAVDGEGNLSKTNGTSLADSLKLPEVWPPAE